jgi:hypothetical protein
MKNNLQVVATREFNGITLNCYQDKEQKDPTDFWATREQIGLALGYAFPREAIGKIHERNKERLDKFSGEVKLTTPSGVQTTTVYNFKGLLEICRYSQQPNANKVIDLLWDIADEIRRTGRYSVKNDNSALPAGVLEGASFIFKAAGVVGNQAVLALDRVYQSYTGRSAIETGGITLTAPTQRQLLTPTEIGKHFGLKAQRVNEILADNGFQHKIFGNWEPLKLGEKFAVMLDVGKIHGKGTAVRQLKWDSTILEVFREFMKGMKTKEEE